MMKKNEHIVLFPFMAQGHIIPFLSLAQQISHRNPHFTITIANTPLNIHRLSTNNTIRNSNNNANIRLAELPFDPTHHGLPPYTENTDTVPPQHFTRLLHASQSLQPHFHSLISTITAQNGRPPICIISDVFFSWAVRVARSFNVPHVAFSTCGAFGTAAYFSLWLNLPHRHTEEEEFQIPGFPETIRFHRSQLHTNMLQADGTDQWSCFFQKHISFSLESDALLCNSVEEIEPLGLRLLRSNTGIPVWPINVSNFGKTAETESEESVVKWLDSHSPGSVLYISFGSQNTISATQMMELAKGVEASKKPFVWAIRPPVGFDLRGEFRTEWLPERFEERGLLIHGWAPQVEILSHKAIGAFLSHCGWNSVLESLSQGVVIIGWPLRAEQTYNSKMLVEEMGVCVEMARGVEGRVVAEEVEKIVRLVMGREGKGEEMRRRAGEIAEKIRSSVREENGERGSSVKALDDFIGSMLMLRKEK